MSVHDTDVCLALSLKGFLTAYNSVNIIHALYLCGFMCTCSQKSSHSDVDLHIILYTILCKLSMSHLGG